MGCSSWVRWPLNEPVPEATVYLADWKGRQAAYDLNDANAKLGVPRKADANGVWEWPSAPTDPE